MPSGPTPDTIKNKGALPLKPRKPRLEWGTQLWARMNSESLGGHLATRKRSCRLKPDYLGQVINWTDTTEPGDTWALAGGL